MAIWPWAKKKPDTLPPAAVIVDVEGIAREAASTAAREAAREAAGEIARAMIANSPMPGAPGPVGGLQTSPYPLYALNYPWQFFTPQAPTKRPQSLVAVEDLRLFADRYDILRSCIQHLKREVLAVPIKFAGRDGAKETAGMKARIQEATTFFRTRGGLGGFGRLRSEFEGMVIEDLCVIGQAAVYFAQARGGWPLEALAIDAATIRPKVDAFGWPGPGEKVYEQWVLGLKIGNGFTREEMSFSGLPTHARSYSPYCASPVEWLLGPILSALKADEWNRMWLTDGNTPADMCALPVEWTPDQIKEFTEWFDAMFSGNMLERVKMRFVPGGSEKVGNPTRKDQEFQEFELWLLRRTCAIMGVQPASIGFAGEQYKVSQENSMDSTTAFGAGVLLEYRANLYDDILERLGYDDLQCVNVTAREEKATERAERLNKLTGGAAIYTPNEARQEEGKDPLPDGDTLFITSTLRPIEQAMEPPPDPLELAKAKASGAPAGGAVKGKAQQRAELQKWERKSLARLQKAGSADCEFETDVLPETVVRFVRLSIGAQDTPEKVRALFQHADTSLGGFGTWDTIAARWRDGLDD